MSKAKYKLRAKQRIRNYLSTEKARLLATAFINRQFYWKFAGKTLISKVQKIHFRILQVVYNTCELNLLMSCLFWIETYRYTRNIYIFWTQKFINQLIIEIPNSWGIILNFSILTYELKKENKVNFPKIRTCLPLRYKFCIILWKFVMK